MRPSPSLIPTRAARLLAVAAVTLAVCAAYTTGLSPDTAFFIGMAKIKDAWLAKLAAEQPHKVAVCGGSSTLFSIDGAALLEQRGLAVVNKGLNAGLGAQVLILYGLEGLRSGDTLVVAAEPGLLTQPFTVPAPGVQFCAGSGRLRYVLSPGFGVQPMGLASAACALRPGADNVLRNLAKVLVRQPAYRYRLSDAGDNPSGWIQTRVRLPLKSAPGFGSRLDPGVRRFLLALRRDCEARGIKVVYSLPWAYARPDQLSGFQQANARFLLQMIEVLPVLRDPSLGGNPDAAEFADTEWHLAGAGSARRTAELGEALATGRLWTADNLRQRLEQLGAVGSP